MKDYIESYHMFFPDKKFRFLLYLVYPLAVWALLYIESIFFDGSFILVFTAAEIIIAVECLADFFIFAGYARKVSSRNEYLKTSVKYTQLLKSKDLNFEIISNLASSNQNTSYDQIIKKIKSIDLNNTTFKEAFDILYNIQQKLKNIQ